MRVRRGDVILVDYLFSDRTGSKVRPCLVVQNDRSNQRLDVTIVVAVSNNTARAMNVPTQFAIDVSSPAGRQSGLLFNSAVQCENLVTIDCAFVIRKIGTLASTTMINIDECLKAALGLQ